MTQENSNSPLEPGEPSPKTSSEWSRQWPWLVIGLVVLISLGSHSQRMKGGAGSSESAEQAALRMIRSQSHILIGLKGMVDGRRAERASEEEASAKEAPEIVNQPDAPENGNEPNDPNELVVPEKVEEVPDAAEDSAEEEEATENSDQGFFSVPDKLLEDQLVIGIDDLKTKAKGPQSARAVATVLVFLGETSAAMEVLDENPSTSAVHAATHRLLKGSAPAEDSKEHAAFALDMEALEEDVGWFAQLARLKDFPAENPERLAFVRATEASMGRFQLVQLGMVAAFAAGLVLLIMAMIRAGRGELRFRFQPLSPQGGVKALQGFAVYFAFFGLFPLALLGLVSIGVVPRSWVSGVVPMIGFGLVAVAVGLAWARRGHAGEPTFWREWGVYPGEGIGHEIRCGFVGYLACLPIMLVGLLLTFAIEQWIVSRGGAPGSHQVAMDLQRSGQLGLLLLLAAVLAPITEELMFRGGFYGAMRRSHRVLASGFFVGFVFAAVHPQGIGHIPALMAMAIGFALLREWRGSLIAPITAHAVHNGLTVLSGSLLFG